MSDIGPWEVPARCIEFPMLTFHITVTAFIAVKRRTHSKAFSTPFYKLYLIQCLSNYMAYSATFINRNHPLYPWSPVPIFMFNVFYDFCGCFQLTTYSVIALNRWTALVRPLRHNEMWNGRRMQLAILTMTLIPLFVGFLRPVAAIVYMQTVNVSYDKGTRLAGSLRSATVTSYNFVITAIDATLEIWSFTAYKSMSFHGKRENLENFRLLAFALLELVPQLIKVMYYLLLTAIPLLFPSWDFLTVEGSVIDVSVNFLLSFQELSGAIWMTAIRFA